MTFRSGGGGRRKGGKPSSFLGQKATFFWALLFFWCKVAYFSISNAAGNSFPGLQKWPFPPLLILPRNGWHPGALGFLPQIPPTHPRSTPHFPSPLPPQQTLTFGAQKRGGGEKYGCDVGKRRRRWLVGWRSVGSKEEVGWVQADAAAAATPRDPRKRRKRKGGKCQVGWHHLGKEDGFHHFYLYVIFFPALFLQSNQVAPSNNVG